MNKIVNDSRNLNIRYDLPEEIWDKVTQVYESMNGWLGFNDDKGDEESVPYWFSFNEDEKCISASVEPSGLNFIALNIAEDEWESWLNNFKKVATEKLGFIVGELELDEVDYEIEWIR